MHPGNTPDALPTGRDGQGNEPAVLLVPHASQPDDDDPVAADARVSEAHGPGGLSRRRTRTRRSGRRSTAGPKASCAAGTSSPSGSGTSSSRRRSCRSSPASRATSSRRSTSAASSRWTATAPRLGPDVPRWYGETIGFWDDDTLITWTSNIQGWTVHGAFEYSNKMQTIEIYTPNRDADRQVPRPQPRSDLLRPRGARGAGPHRPQPRQDERFRGRRSVRLHRLRPDDLPRWKAAPRRSRRAP